MKIKTTTINIKTNPDCEDIQRSSQVLKFLYETIKMHIYDYNHVYQKYGKYEDVWQDPEFEDELISSNAKIVIGYVPDDSYACVTMTQDFKSTILESLQHLIGQTSDITLSIEEDN